MRKWKTALLGLAAVAAVSAEAAADTAARTDRPIVPVSRIINEVQTRDDFGKLSAMHYDLRTHAYWIMYTRKDGLTKTVVIDAMSGRAKGRSEARHDAGTASPATY
jgi:hypothetical protein